MDLIAHLRSTLIAASPAATVGAALLALVPLAAAYGLLLRAGRRPRAPGPAAQPHWTDALRVELADNYDRRRHAGEAVLLTTDAWRRLRPRAGNLPAVLRRQIARTYHAISVSNRLLAAAADYDHRGHLSLRRRRIQLWPTLETAVRGALAALGAAPAPALRTTVRPATADVRQPAPVAGRSTGCAAHLAPFRLDDAPRLSLFHGPAEPPALTEAAAPRAAAPRLRTRRRSAAARPRRRSAGQMPLWEYVA
jgi:hypothetical protein